MPYRFVGDDLLELGMTVSYLPLSLRLFKPIFFLMVALSGCATVPKSGLEGSEAKGRSLLQDSAGAGELGVGSFA